MSEIFMKEVYSHLKPVNKVRAIHYDLSRGIFLIRTVKSGGANVWTTPGGDLLDNENNLEGLQRHVKLDVGTDLIRADPLHFYTISYPSGNNFVTTYAHFVEISLNFTKNRLEGTTPTLLPYRFVTLREIENGSVRTTKSISEMAREDSFKERILSMARGKAISV